ncbi:hypothetical protein NE237_019317 [Protea cynaroides]|uniref:Uncharacterized protein n=1 Tax=Protea cynaroides TaxID=273540 RepID=A0A9Q0QPV9_9MAGN|nr:hypothetical protein NE237_019317 [Protea cynaroides]
MKSCISFPGGHGENLQEQGDNNTISLYPKHPSSRRTHSFSCSSSLGSSSSSGSSSFEDSSPSSPITPVRFSGSIPFSWEQHPGIPKKYLNSRSPSKTKDASSLVLLPLPPPPNPTPSKRFNLETILKKNPQDPFLVALMECSKDRQDGVDDCWKRSAKVSAVSRTLSDRLGLFIDLYGSCKNSCDVSNSTFFIPKSSRERYHLLNHRKG